MSGDYVEPGYERVDDEDDLKAGEEDRESLELDVSLQTSLQISELGAVPGAAPGASPDLDLQLSHHPAFASASSADAMPLSLSISPPKPRPYSPARPHDLIHDNPHQSIALPISAVQDETGVTPPPPVAFGVVPMDPGGQLIEEQDLGQEGIYSSPNRDNLPHIGEVSPFNSPQPNRPTTPLGKALLRSPEGIPNYRKSLILIFYFAMVLNFTNVLFDYLMLIRSGDALHQTNNDCSTDYNVYSDNGFYDCKGDIGECNANNDCFARNDTFGIFVGHCLTCRCCAANIYYNIWVSFIVFAVVISIKEGLLLLFVALWCCQCHRENPTDVMSFVRDSYWLPIVALTNRNGWKTYRHGYLSMELKPNRCRLITDALFHNIPSLCLVIALCGQTNDWGWIELCSVTITSMALFLKCSTLCGAFRH